MFVPISLWGQVRVNFEEVKNQELLDFFGFENIQFLKINFTSKDLKNKTYQLSVKEIWDGVIKEESTIVDSREIPLEQLKIVGDTILRMRVISKLTDKNKLKMEFKFPNFSITKSFDAISSDDYSLRNVIKTGKAEFGKKFYLLVYMLPYEKDETKYYCAVEGSGKEIETWGKAFDIKHYLVFEIKFE